MPPGLGPVAAGRHRAPAALAGAIGFEVFEILESDVREQLEIDAHYAGYLDRQEADIVAFRRDESLSLPDELDYEIIAGLSVECRQKLTRIRPRTLGQAARIDGVTPVALTLVLAHVKARSKSGALRRVG